MRKLRNRHPRRCPRHFRPVADMPIRCRPRLPIPLARLVEPPESPSLSADVLTACPACAWRTLLQIALRLAWPWRGYRSDAIDSRQKGHMMHNAIRRSPRAGMRALHVTVSCVALATYSVSGITSAQAACVASAAAASQTDASTSQALEAVRDRRMQVAQSCPAGSTPGANGMCVPVAGSATVTSASTPNAQPPGQPAAKKARAAAAPAPGAPYGSLKDGP